MTLTQYLKENNLKNTKAVKFELAKSVGFDEYTATAEDNDKLVKLLTKTTIKPKTGLVDLYTKSGEPANVKEYAEKIKVADDQSDVLKGFTKTTFGYLIK